MGRGRKEIGIVPYRCTMQIVVCISFWNHSLLGTLPAMGLKNFIMCRPAATASLPKIVISPLVVSMPETKESTHSMARSLSLLSYTVVLSVPLVGFVVTDTNIHSSQ